MSTHSENNVPLTSVVDSVSGRNISEGDVSATIAILVIVVFSIAFLYVVGLSGWSGNWSLVKELFAIITPVVSSVIGYYLGKRGK